MQIFELTQPKQRKLNEYDPSRSPPGTPNYASGGAGTTPQMTATPGTTAKAPVTATSNYSGGQQTVTPTTNQSAPASATASPAATPNYSAGTYNQTSNAPTASVPATSTSMPSNMQPTAPQAAPASSAPSQPTYNAPVANVPATNTVMPSNMSATGAPVATPAPAPAPAPTPAPAPIAGVDPELAAAGKVKMTGPQGKKANIGGAIANAMQAYNANKVGLGYLLPKDAKNEVYTDSTGKITIDGKPYDAKNPEHQRIVGKITIGNEPYNGADPEHRAAYLAFKNTAGRGTADIVKIDPSGKVTIAGQPFNPGNPGHVMAYRQHVLSSSVAHAPPPAPAQQPPAQQPAAQSGQPAQPSPTTESLTWSRNFDPSATLLKKMKLQP